MIFCDAPNANDDDDVNSYRFANPAEALRGLEASRLGGLVFGSNKRARVGEGKKSEEKKKRGEERRKGRKEERMK